MKPTADELADALAVLAECVAAPWAYTDEARADALDKAEHLAAEYHEHTRRTSGKQGG